MNSNGLRHHRADHPQELEQPLKIPLGPVLELDGNRSDTPPMQQNRNTNEAEVPTAALTPGSGPMQESRILTEEGHDQRLPRCGNRSGDSLTEAVTSCPALVTQPYA